MNNQNNNNINANDSSNINNQQNFNNMNNLNTVNNQQNINNNIYNAQQQVNNNEQINYSNSTIINQQNNIDYNEDELIKLFIKDNYDKISKKSFNFAAFFFSGLYFMYRKMYLTGLILMIVEALLSTFLAKYTFIISIVIGLICGFIFNNMYINEVKNKIEKMKNDNSLDIKNKCVKDGGTSLLIAILSSFAYGTIISIIIGLSTFGKIFSNFNFSIGPSKDLSNIENKAVNFLNEIDHYGKWSVIQRNSKGMTFSTVNGKEYKYASIPTAQDGGNIACILDEGSSSWHDSDKYTLSKDSTSCSTFMDEFVSNYLKEVNSPKEYYGSEEDNEEDEDDEIKIEVPDSAEIIFSSDGYVQQDSVIYYDGVKCTYNINNEVECK